MGRRQIPIVPCGVCKEDADHGRSIFCDSCQLWFHNTCEELSTAQFEELGRMKAEYLCKKCTHVDGKFDFTASLRRLGISAAEGLQCLETAILLESILVRSCDRFDYQEIVCGCRTVDSVAMSLIQKMSGTCMNMKPVAVSADGNCLFNALSVAAFGDESVADQLRVLTTIELAKFQSFYSARLTDKDLHLVSPDFDEAVVACATSGRFSSAWTILAAATVLQRDIASTYPAVNGVFDGCFKILNTTFHPRVGGSGLPINIMWTSMVAPVPKRTWLPNHFVPLLRATTAARIDVSADTSMQISVSSNSLHSDIPELPYSPIEDDDPVFTYSRQEVPDRSEETLRSSTPSKSCKRRRSSDPDCKPQPLINQLPSVGKFMSLDQIVNIVKTGDATTVNDVPLGPKDNVYFLIDDSANHQKRKSKQRSDYPDDCGVWDSKKGNSVKSLFVLHNDKPRTVYYKEKLYCTESRIKGKSTYIPLEPQPSDVYTVHRYYATLKADQTYKKRVTCVCGPEQPPIATIEYCGKYPGQRPVHGNVKRQKPEYIRTDPKIMEKIATAIETKRPREVYQDMANNSLEAPRDFKQIRDKKYREQKKGHQYHRSNIADEVLATISLLNENPQVQEIIHKKGKAPSLILYSDDQFQDLKRNLNSGSILGIDRTFNLGPCYVTTIVYKNMSVLHKESNMSPLFLGPMFLHWDGEFTTYHSFFSHLYARLEDCSTKVEIKVGSDQEAAILKAIKLCFPNATHLLCTKHLKDNVIRYLTDKVGCPTKRRIDIVGRIFGDNGLVKCQDLFSFEKKFVQLLNFVSEFPVFRCYIEKMKSLLYEYVCEPHQRGDFAKLWTNNNSESMNNVLKLAIDWKPQKLPDLVEKLCSVTKLQMLDLRRSLYGTGNYVLLPKFKKYAISRDVWLSKSEDDKCNLFQSFLMRKKCKEGSTKATNVNFSVPQSCTTKVAKKPGQRKRSKSERSR